MINLLDISVPKQTYPDHSNIKFESMDFYLDLARKLVNTLLTNSFVAQKILKNDDYISYLATYIMMADWTWNGRGTKYGYRKQCVVWALKTMFTRYKKQQQCLSLNNRLNNYFTSEHPLSFIDILVDKHKDIQHNENVELVENMLSNSKLTKKQKKYLNLYYFEGKSLDNVGQDCGVSRAAVSCGIKRAIRKIRKKYQCLMF